MRRDPVGHRGTGPVDTDGQRGHFRAGLREQREAPDGPSRAGGDHAAPIRRAPGHRCGPLPPIPRTKVQAAPGEHPLLEFSHPALGAVGLACWFLFVGLHYRPLAWISFGIVVVTVAAGLGWLTSNARAAKRRGNAARAPFPPRLVMLHGLAATATVVLAVLTALSAGHG